MLWQHCIDAPLPNLNDFQFIIGTLLNQCNFENKQLKFSTKFLKNLKNVFWEMLSKLMFWQHCFDTYLPIVKLRIKIIWQPCSKISIQEPIY